MARSTMSPRSASIAGSSSSTSRKSARSWRSASAASQIASARSAQSSSPIPLIGSFEAKNSAQIQNAAKQHDDGEHDVAPRARPERRLGRGATAGARGGRHVAGARLGGSRRRAGRPPPPTPTHAAMTAPIQPSQAVQSRPMAWSRLTSPGPIAATAHAADGDRHRVLPAVLEHEEVAAVRGVAGDDHHADHPGGGERREQPGGEQDAGAELGAGREAGLHVRPAHPDRAEPAGGAGQPAAAEDLVVAVGGEEQTEHQSHDEEREVGGIHGRHPTEPASRPSRPRIPAPCARRRRAGRKAGRGHRGPDAAVRARPRGLRDAARPDRACTAGRSSSPSSGAAVFALCTVASSVAVQLGHRPRHRAPLRRGLGRHRHRAHRRRADHRHRPAAGGRRRRAAHVRRHDAVARRRDARQASVSTASCASRWRGTTAGRTATSSPAPASTPTPPSPCSRRCRSPPGTVLLIVVSAVWMLATDLVAGRRRGRRVPRPDRAQRRLPAARRRLLRRGPGPPRRPVGRRARELRGRAARQGLRRRGPRDRAPGRDRRPPADGADRRRAAAGHVRGAARRAAVDDQRRARPARRLPACAAAT